MIFDKYQIITDENNYIVQELKTRKKDGVEFWQSVAYYPINCPELAYQNVLMRKIHASHKDELRFVIKVICEAKSEIMKAINHDK